MSDTIHNRRRSYPLSVLFVLMTACGVVSAFTAPVVRAVVSGGLRVTDALVAHVVGGLVGLMIGAILGLYHYRRVRGLFWGVATGIGVGFMAGPIVLAPPRESAHLAITSVCGAVLLFILGAVLFCSPRRRSARISDPAETAAALGAGLRPRRNGRPKVS